jgi:PilZ domain
MNNKRKDQRVSTNLSARWEGILGRHEGRIEDLSLAGCFVNTVGRADVGEVMEVEIKLSSGEWLKLRGEVRFFQEGFGFGFLFSGVTAEEEQALREIIV